MIRRFGPISCARQAFGDVSSGELWLRLMTRPTVGVKMAKADVVMALHLRAATDALTHVAGDDG